MEAMAVVATAEVTGTVVNMAMGVLESDQGE